MGYEGSVPRTIDTVVVSTQHSPSVSNERLPAEVEEVVIRPVLERSGLDFADLSIIGTDGKFRR